MYGQQLVMFRIETATAQQETPAVSLQLRTWCKACRRRHAAGLEGACGKCASTVHTFTSLRACTNWLLTATYYADECLVMQQDADGKTALVAGGYIEAVRQWAQTATQEED